MQPWLGLLAPDGTVVFDNYNTLSQWVDRGITKAGKYTVRVRDHTNGIGPYVLSFSQLSKESRSFPSGSAVQTQLEFAGEVHWYTFDAQVGDAVSIVLTNGSNNSMQPWLGLLAPDGTLVFENYNTLSQWVDRGITKAGKYTIRVRDHTNGTGPYVLSYSQLSQPSNPVSSGTSITGQIRFAGDVQ